MSRRRPIDDRILAAAHQPRTLHDLTLALWPDLDQGPRETALSAIAYLRHRVAALVVQGRLVLGGGMMQAQAAVVRVRAAARRALGRRIALPALLAIFGLLGSCHPRPPRQVPLQELPAGAALAADDRPQPSPPLVLEKRPAGPAGPSLQDLYDLQHRAKQRAARYERARVGLVLTALGGLALGALALRRRRRENARTGGERGAVRLDVLAWGALVLSALVLIGGGVRLLDLQEEAEAARTGIAAVFVLSGLLLAAAALSPRRRRRERGAVRLDLLTGTWAIAALVLVVAIYCLSPAAAQPRGAPPPPPTEDRSPPAPPPVTYSPLGIPRELQQGLIALATGSPAYAHRLCERVARLERLYRVQALLCQGRAMLGLKWPEQAEQIARQILRERPGADRQLIADVRTLLGDTWRARAKCALARTEYLLALEAQPDHPGALAGLKACQADPPRPAGPGAQAVPHA